MPTQQPIDPADALAIECEKKARMFLQNALGPVITDIGKAHGRDGIIAFSAALQINFALEMRAALGTGIVMEVIKQSFMRVKEETDAEVEQAMTKAAHEMLTPSGAANRTH